ncbi:MAG: hypothetical protein GF308_08840 [Candidatus Heimdallarchaeota archaeon]|nr:hypothetical protein [Candidatus Heimdallarchaeota archaeon]
MNPKTNILWEMLFKNFEAIWEWSGWDGFYDRVDRRDKDKIDENFFAQLAHSLLVETTQIALEQRLEMMKKGPVPRIAGALFSIMSLFNGNIGYICKDGRIIKITEVSGVDPYVLTAVALHELGGFHGINYARDIKDGKYTPIIGLIKYFKHVYDQLDEFSESIEGNRFFPIFEMDDNGEVIYDSDGLPKINFDTTAGKRLFSDTLTRVRFDGENQLVARPIDFATNAGMRHVFDSLLHAAMLTENVQRTEYSPINTLIEKLGLYDLLNQLQDTTKAYQAYTYNSDTGNKDPVRVNFLGLDQKSIDKSVIKSPFGPIKCGTLSVTELQNQLAKLGITNVDPMSFYRDFGRTELAREIGETAYTLGDFAMDATVFVLKGENGYRFFKTVLYQVVDSSGNPVKTSSGVYEWGVKLVELTADTDIKIRDLNDDGTLDKQYAKGEKDPETKKVTLTDKYGKKIKHPLVSIKDGERTTIYTTFVMLDQKLDRVQTSEKDEEGSLYYDLEKVVDPTEIDEGEEQSMLDQFKEMVNSHAGLENAEVIDIAQGTSGVKKLLEAAKDMLINRLENEKIIKYPNLRNNPWFTTGNTELDSSILSLDSPRLNGAKIVQKFEKWKIKFANWEPNSKVARIIARVVKPLMNTPENMIKYVHKNKKNIIRGLQFSLLFVSIAFPSLLEAGPFQLSLAVKALIAIRRLLSGRSNFLSVSNMKMTAAQETMGVTSTVNSFHNQVGSQLWMSPLIEGAVMTGYIDTMAKNMRGTIGNGTAVGERGPLVEKFAMDYQPGDPGYYPGINEDHNKTRHELALQHAVWVWVTDYMELGEYWEIINGYASGKQLALIDCGMTPINNGTKEVFVDDPVSMYEVLKGLYDLNGLTVPWWLDNKTRFLHSPSFKWVYEHLLLNILGGIISAVTSAINEGAKACFLGGIASVYSSMLAGFFVQKVYQQAYTITAERSWKNRYVNYYSSVQYQKGDPGYNPPSYSFWLGMGQVLINWLAPDVETYIYNMLIIGGSVMATIMISNLLGLLIPQVVPYLSFPWVGVVIFGVALVAGTVYLTLKHFGVIEEMDEYEVGSTYGDPPA